jgi:tryptophan-rich sensory protein
VKKIIVLGFCIILCLSIGILGSFTTIGSIPNWYAYLNKPVFSPPNWIFGPVWSVLYILMGISIYLIWLKGFKTKKIREAVYLFGVQLILNAIWTPVFFGLKNTMAAFVIIVLMWLFILKTIMAFQKINKTAAYLLYPYLAWVSFASILNFSIWFLNR